MKLQKQPDGELLEGFLFSFFCLFCIASMGVKRSLHQWAQTQNYVTLSSQKIGKRSPAGVNSLIIPALLKAHTTKEISTPFIQLGTSEAVARSPMNHCTLN